MSEYENLKDVFFDSKYNVGRGLAIYDENLDKNLFNGFQSFDDIANSNQGLDQIIKSKTSLNVIFKSDMAMKKIINSSYGNNFKLMFNSQQSIDYLINLGLDTFPLMADNQLLLDDWMIRKNGHLTKKQEPDYYLVSERGSSTQNSTSIVYSQFNYDLTNYNKIKIDYTIEFSNTSYGNYVNVRFGVQNKITDSSILDAYISVNTKTSGIRYLEIIDVSKLSGKYYLKIYLNDGNTKNFHYIRLKLHNITFIK